MTTRRWMVVVVVVGLVMGGIRLEQRRAYFLSQEWYFSAMEVACQKTKEARVRALKYHSPLGKEQVRRELLEGIAREDQVIPYYAAMARKYRHAIRYPWLPVEPDPPAP
jgi:hypothetical protein